METALITILVTAAVTLTVALLQHGHYARRQAERKETHEKEMAKLKEAHDIEMAKLANENTQRARLEARAEGAIAAMREARTLSLERLWNAISIAMDAADTMIAASATQNVELLVEQTVKFLREMTPLLTETRAARHNLSLAEQDVQMALSIRREAVKLFLSLDLDSGPLPQYRDRLQQCKTVLGEAIRAFKQHVDVVRTTHSPSL